MPDWLIGLLAPVAGAAALAGLALFTKRVNLYDKCYRLGTFLRGLGIGYDIPVIGGAAEASFKEKALSTVSDAIRGLARGLAGKMREDMEVPKVISAKPSG